MLACGFQLSPRDCQERIEIGPGVMAVVDFTWYPPYPPEAEWPGIEVREWRLYVNGVEFKPVGKAMSGPMDAYIEEQLEGYWPEW